MLTGALLLLAGCGDATPPNEPAGRVEPVRITQFYSPTPRVALGEQVTLCYGVQNAVSVRVEPPVEELMPSLARCLVFAPKGASYTLVARGKGGDEVSQTVTIGLNGDRPKFTDLRVNATRVKPGESVQFCFKAVHATAVAGGPGRFAQGGNPAADCLVDNPQRTTVYRLTVSTADGLSDADEIKVEVK
jgi:hypothetical protein